VPKSSFLKDLGDEVAAILVEPVGLWGANYRFKASLPDFPAGLALSIHVSRHAFGAHAGPLIGRKWHHRTFQI